MARTPKQQKLLTASLRYSLNAVEAKIKLGKYYPVKKGSHLEEALETLMNTRAEYIKLLEELT